MRHLFLLLCFITVFLFVSCYDGRFECIDSKEFVSINLMSTSNVDSMDVYLNDELICHSTYKELYVKLANEDFFSNVLIAESSSYLYKDVILCTPYENCPSWKSLGCFERKLNIDEDTISLNLTLHIFNVEKKDELNIRMSFPRGNQINIIPEQDTTKWFSYVDNPIKPGHEAFVSPATSNRMGCFDGYCVATLPMERKEFCYDK
jgi:hypothetical protein